MALPMQNAQRYRHYIQIERGIEKLNENVGKREKGRERVRKDILMARVRFRCVCLMCCRCSVRFGLVKFGIGFWYWYGVEMQIPFSLVK